MMRDLNIDYSAEKYLDDELDLSSPEIKIIKK